MDNSALSILTGSNILVLLWITQLYPFSRTETSWFSLYGLLNFIHSHGQQHIGSLYGLFSFINSHGQKHLGSLFMDYSALSILTDSNTLVLSMDYSALSILATSWFSLWFPPSPIPLRLIPWLVISK